MHVIVATALVFSLLSLSHGFVSYGFAPHRFASQITKTTRIRLFNSKWDNLEDEDDEQLYKVAPDMTYVPRNVMRQNQHYLDISEASGPTHDVYVRNPSNDVFWFCGKVARVSDVSLERCVARQWSLVEEHAATLRPLELSSKRGELQIWTAPGDSELDVAYNRPDLAMQKMDRGSPDSGTSSGSKIRNTMVGFLAEIYDEDEEGFRTWRTEEGLPANPEASLEELEKVLESMGGMDGNELDEEEEEQGEGV